MKTCLPLALAVLLSSAGAAAAGNLIYQPVNPAFGGSPLNGAWLQSEASAQNIPQARQQRETQLFSTNSSLSRFSDLSPSQIFAQQLQSQLYSSLANQITRAIFGENAQQSGTFSFQGTTINFERIGPNVRVTINDGQTNTEVVVPAGP
ncbi:curli assembly protein CsgF [Methylorubrum thiocyanatum]|jgi:curli production assembly/transport component CsgF|uniref:curli assembly protein CsgF n=1 Tax=Methylorubrum thiocyanatum TaxID=47958 RepID=UPI00383BEF7E